MLLLVFLFQMEITVGLRVLFLGIYLSHVGEYYFKIMYD